MSLFSSADAQPPKDSTSLLSATLEASLSGTIGALPKALKESVSQVSTDTLIHFRTGGKWHRHQLLTHLLNQTGPADVYMSTWSMTEDPVRALYMLKKVGLLKKVHIVVSERINERTPEVMQLARNVFDTICFDKLHAKADVIIGEKLSVVVVGSANLTRNPKEEIGVIHANKAAVDFHLTWIKDKLWS